mmetsp:Transcript_35597/g.96533  ORF Transcript_35597/g.96533 Transcript_35597/m.96533 type:complete len:274 (+) Transcript_35597:506-1327(+)
MPFGMGFEEARRFRKRIFLSASGAPFARCRTRGGISTSPRGPMLFQGARSCSAANSSASSLHCPVAETRSRCARLGAGSLSTSRRRWSWRETLSSMSISSRTTALSCERSRRPSMAWSMIRPGVPTTATGSRCFRESSCRWWLAPPMSRVQFSSGKGASRSLTTRWIWAASSRLGATTSSLGLAQTFGMRCTGVALSRLLPRGSSAPRSRSLCSSGTRNARVLPEPVPELSTTSSPRSISGMACSCSTFGSVTPLSRMTPIISSLLSPVMPSS